MSGSTVITTLALVRHGSTAVRASRWTRLPRGPAWTTAPAGPPSGSPRPHSSTLRSRCCRAAVILCRRASATSWPVVMIPTSGAGLRDTSEVLARNSLFGIDLEEPGVLVDDLLGLAAHHHLALVDPDAVVAELADTAHRVADQEHGPAVGRQFLHLVGGLGLELGVTGRQGLVDHQDIRVHVHGDREGHPREHAGR